MKYLFFIFLAGVLFVFQPAKGQLFNDEGLKFMKLFDWIKSRYVDSVDIEKLSDEIIRESLHKLDPHSVYLTKDEVKDVNESLEGNFEGIGVNFNLLNDTIYIVNTIKGGPSEKAGVKAGDRIVTIEGENVAGIHITSKQVASKLKGQRGSNVSIEVKRRNTRQLIKLAIIRDKIPIKSIDAAYKADAQTGYIKLSRFSHTSVIELTKVLTDFKKENVQNLILDLSGNGGGYFDVAITLADEFLDADKLIVSTKGVHADKKEFSTAKGLFEKGKLIIIIDEGSASASEIVAGAVQDWDRGLIVGRRSFGKGLVQTQLIFPDESLVRLTVARYYTPTGRLIQKPYANGYKEYNTELNKRIEHGELLNKDSIQFNDSLIFHTLNKKRRVFGGGGIMPDVFVPVDTSSYSPYYRKLLLEGIVNRFVLEYVDNNRDKLRKKYSSFKSFSTNFYVDDNLLQSLIAYAENKHIKYNSAQFEHSKLSMFTYIKALIARNLWENNEFYEINNQTDPSFVKAMEILKNWDSYWTSN